MSLTPRSLSGQIAMVLTAALLVASAVNFGFLLSERRQSAMVEASGPAITRLADFVEQVASGQQPNPRRLQERGPGFSRFRFAEASPIETRNLDRNRRLEQRLARALTDAGVEVTTIHAATRLLAEDEFRQELVRLRERNRPPDFQQNRFEPDDSDRRPDGPPPGEPRWLNNQEIREIVLSVQLPDGRWIVSDAFAPGPPRSDIVQLGISTLVLFVCVLTAALWVASRLSRPLADLTAAAQQVGAAGEPQHVAVRGPADVRSTIESFNAMSQRVTQLLNEKDVMLGALGHDLRTPLTSLRIRLESMEPPADREKAIATVEETTALLQTILDLARQGRSSEPLQLTDMAVFVERLAADYAETGAAVRLNSAATSEIACRPVLLRRLFRNVIDNALAYGVSATLNVSVDGGWVIVSVDDEGPGMEPDAIESARQPFVRGEASRNRRTGGAGLGLALADAIAKAHHGELLLANRPTRGLRATIRLPLADRDPSGDVAV